MFCCFHVFQPQRLSLVSGATDWTFWMWAQRLILIHFFNRSVQFTSNCHFIRLIHLIPCAASMAISMSAPLACQPANEISIERPSWNYLRTVVELSIRYWLSNNNFPLFNLIVLEPHSTYEQAWVREHCLLGYWQTMLNHPLFLVLRLKSEGWTLQFQASRSPPIKLGPRLFSALAKTSSHCGQCSQWTLQPKQRPAYITSFKPSCSK